jgi:hypothetical protein
VDIDGAVYSLDYAGKLGEDAIPAELTNRP